MEKKFKIRDKRNKGWFYLDNDYLNGYTRLVSPYATLVYLSLCRHADAIEQKAFPSIKKMSEEFNISEDSVRKGVKELEKINIIVVKRVGKKKNNEYWLVDKSEWVKKEKVKPYKNRRKITRKSEPDNTGITSEPDNTGAVNPIIQGSEPDNTGGKDTHRRKTHINNTNINIYTDDDVRLTKLLYAKVKENYPFLIDKKTEKQWENDYKEMNRLHRINGWTYRQIEYIIRWSQQDSFWRQNIRSVTKLRKQFENLVVRAKEQSQQKGGVIKT